MLDEARVAEVAEVAGGRPMNPGIPLSEKRGWRPAFEPLGTATSSQEQTLKRQTLDPAMAPGKIKGGAHART